ncbi:uncharacterized protein JCM6883_004714 [Sporobolomyces salmoneus]|uniref:uncharacterized protein n=1 Tax=Sporobolomyces salmoneus TaxID=183962 RepID=UPI00316BFA58
MRFTLPTVAALLSVVSSVMAQSTGNIPACALTCLTSSVSSSPCASTGITGLNCICTNQEFQASYYQCQQSSCSASDLEAALSYGASVCAQNGTPINISAVPSGASSAAASGISSASSSVASQSSSLSSAISSAASSASRASSSLVASGSSAQASATSSPTSGSTKTTLSGLVAGGLALAAVVMA